MGFVEQGDELGTDDGTSGIVLSGLQRLFVGDAETYHTRIAQVHRVDATEVGLLLLVERLLRARDGGGGNHVDEAIGVLVDEADAFIGGFGCDEHNDAKVVAVGHGLHLFQIVLEGKVGNDHSADATLDARLTEGFDAIVQDGIEVAHEDEGDVDLLSDGLKLGEEQLEIHSVAQGFRGSSLNDGPIGKGVAEGYAYLDEVDASALHCEDDVARGIERGGASTEVEGKEFLVAALGKELIDLVHSLGGLVGELGEETVKGFYILHAR